MNLSPKSFSFNPSHYFFSPVPSLPNYSSTDSDWFLNQETMDIIDDTNWETRKQWEQRYQIQLNSRRRILNPPTKSHPKLYKRRNLYFTPQGPNFIYDPNMDFYTTYPRDLLDKFIEDRFSSSSLTIAELISLIGDIC